MADADGCLGLEETELRLGLPGGEAAGSKTAGKRAFADAIDLKLKLPLPSAPKAQVVGWPPVRSFRKNVLSQSSKEEKERASSNAAAFVKVSMDGAPYLRKVDLRTFTSYQELSAALEKMFGYFTTAGGRDFMNESRLMDLLTVSDYVPTYEDKDGDWMLVGDVPWEMFVDSCKRLRIMKGSEAIGIAPKAMEKCRMRS